MENNSDNQVLLEKKVISDELRDLSFNLLDIESADELNPSTIGLTICLAVFFSSGEDFYKYSYGNGLSAFKPKSDFIFINSEPNDSEKGIYLKELPDETANKKGKVYLGISFFDIEERSPSLVDYLSDIISIFSNSNNSRNEYKMIQNVYGKCSSKPWSERFFLPSIKINEVFCWDKILSELIEPENF